MRGLIYKRLVLAPHDERETKNMMLLYGLAALGVVWWLSKVFVRTDTKAVAKAVKIVGGVLALGAAALLGMKGRIDMALLLGGFGAWALGWSGMNLSLPWRRSKPEDLARFRSAMIEMEVDRRSGAISGAVLAGGFTGRRLGDLDQQSLQALYGECRSLDAEGAALLEAYFDRRFPGWREYAQGNGDTRARPQPGAMSKEEAYQVLGLQPGASLDEIRESYRRLMKKLHPDQGGTAHLAARVNQAREVLLSRHR
ncbi:J domain-containing protein [Microvirga antarctica]|uniref:J domain-containing protein n=1 Tax=Microvirga antarctica TaxID=2819233 RepID=UPI00248486B3|nr:DnaJ domain-containing protein [Microvirga antarctica]